MFVKLLSPRAKLPTKAHDTDAGFDLYIPFDFKIEPILWSGIVSVIDLDIAVEVPTNNFCLLKERSSLAMRGMVISAGVIDWGYRGMIKVVCHNVSQRPIEFRKHDRIAQLLVLPYYGILEKDIREVESVTRTQRGEGGFGSSGS